MPLLFEIQDRNGKIVRLTTEQWAHVNEEHPDVSNPEELRETILNPTLIKSSACNPENAKAFYRYNKKKRRYLFVAVNYLNGDGFIITAHYRRTIQ